jgi:alcohol dehydrogenase class IV
LPEIVIYDVDLTVSLPAGLAATSGINAIAHAVEALYARDRNPMISLMAEEGIRALADAPPAIIKRPGHREARGHALYGAWLCGVCLGTVGMALHHKLCHTLGGTFDLPHAATHAIMLPHAMMRRQPFARHQFAPRDVLADRVRQALIDGPVVVSQFQIIEHASLASSASCPRSPGPLRSMRQPG